MNMFNFASGGACVGSVGGVGVGVSLELSGGSRVGRGCRWVGLFPGALLHMSGAGMIRPLSARHIEGALRQPGPPSVPPTQA